MPEDHLIGDAWPAATPASDPVSYGHARIEPPGAFEVRSVQTFSLVYTVGRFGIDDSGSIRIVFRMVGDFGRFQTTDPTAPDYLTAHTDGEAGVEVEYHRAGHQRPWFKACTVRVTGGYLREGDTITVVFGDVSGGSPGMRLPTFVEPEFTFKVLADVCAVGHYTPVPDTPTISIVPGAPSVWRAVLPSLRRPGQPFHLGIKAEDRWGNPTGRAESTLRLVPSMEVDGLPETLDYELGTLSRTFEDLTVSTPGTLRIGIETTDGQQLAESTPLVVAEGRHDGFWGDLHGQSGESIGVNTAEEYFEFARHRSFLEVTSHQANDFQVNNAFWLHLNALTEQLNVDGRFVTFPGYEWSGNTGVGGDRNVFFRTENRSIRRSSHALLPDKSDIDTDANTAAALFEALRDEDCVVFAHVGGRYADIAQAHDDRLETAMEIHSAWGTFEWLLTDGFRLGHRSGVVCNSDGHKGRPGASYPGASQFGAYGGLTCFLTDDLSRDGIFECLRRRHHYGTTGTRMHLDVRARFASPGTLFHRDPRWHPDPPTESTDEVMMGDIAQLDADDVTLSVHAVTHAPIERIEVRNGTEVVRTLRGHGADDLGSRIRVLWSGAEYRGRGRDTQWLGRARFDGATIQAMTKINAWNHERRLECHDDHTVVWDAITTGNFGGFDVWLDESAGGHLSITTNHGDLECRLDSIGLDDVRLDAGGLARELRVMRLPEVNPHRELSAEVTVPLHSEGDNPLWVCVTTEDGFQAWSSPIYLERR